MKKTFIYKGKKPKVARFAKGGKVTVFSGGGNISMLSKLKKIDLSKVKNEALKNLIEKNIKDFDESKSSDKGKAQLEQMYSLVEKKYPEAIGEKESHPENGNSFRKAFNEGDKNPEPKFNVGDKAIIKSGKNKGSIIEVYSIGVWDKEEKTYRILGSDGFTSYEKDLKPVPAKASSRKETFFQKENKKALKELRKAEKARVKKEKKSTPVHKTETITETRTEKKSEHKTGETTKTEKGNDLHKKSDTEYVLKNKDNDKMVAVITKENDMWVSDCCEKRDGTLYPNVDAAIFYTELVWDYKVRAEKAKDAARARRKNEKEREAKGLPTRATFVEQFKKLKSTTDNKIERLKIPKKDANKISKVADKSVTDISKIKIAKKMKRGGNI